MIRDCYITDCEHIHETKITTPAKAGGPLALYRRRVADRWYDKLYQVARRELEQEYDELQELMRVAEGRGRVESELVPKWEKRKMRRRLPVLLRLAVESYKAAGGEEPGKAARLEEYIPQELAAQRMRPDMEEYLWGMHQIENETTVALYASIVAEGHEKLWTPGEMAAALAERAEHLSRSRADTIARTVTIWTENSAADRRYRDSSAVKLKKWLVTEDDLTCPLCLAQDGKTIAPGKNFFDEGDMIEDVEGEQSYAATFDVGWPPLHPRCRCCIVPV